METADWLAIEDGRLPEPGQLRPMAKVLDFKFEQLAVLDRMRRKAWQAEPHIAAGPGPSRVLATDTQTRIASSPERRWARSLSKNQESSEW
jgi:hypothetical protein